MKRLFLIFFLLSFLFITAQVKSDSSKIYCKYEISFLKDTLVESSRVIENAILLIGDEVSLFKSQLKYDSDSIRNEVKKQAIKTMDPYVLQQINKVVKPKFTEEVFMRNDTVHIYAKILTDYYVFVSDKNIQWKITDDLKNISTFECRKAIGKYGKREITAWFTTKVPIPEGPYNFKGLPGLIIEAYDEKKYYHFILKQLKESIVPIEPEKKAVSTSYNKFVKVRRDFIDDPSGYFRFKTGGRFSSYTTKAKNDQYDQRMRSDNNHLD